LYSGGEEERDGDANLLHHQLLEVVARSAASGKEQDSVRTVYARARCKSI
jgi:hypothetical protein